MQIKAKHCHSLTISSYDVIMYGTYKSAFAASYDVSTNIHPVLRF
ncbi:hypothetical protein CFter6_2228 [Collimonas fungivorans]|uniref:Uncharacterized protein n=1 Tax=Collimonas fungivorans TaxID=158899 RepID=A0A127PAT1_9BURK|nr:hypothetical protein CFter6_2228 [Collimonas fungivorans]